MNDYELLDSGNKRRLERFGEFILDRPDPEAMWERKLSTSEWQKADAIFDNKWVVKNKKLNNGWIVNYKNIKFQLKLTPFKHVGVFPEQSFQWDMIANSVQRIDDRPEILNLFGYTGAASLVALANGASVTHVDASRPAIGWFVENLKLNKLDKKPVRFIPEDALTFVEREIKRGNKYDAIIMDPPVYGHGPKGETWDFSKKFPILLDQTVKLLSDNPKFVIINAYAVSTSPVTLANILKEKTEKLGGKVTYGELSLNEKSAGRILTTGIYAIWER